MQQLASQYLSPLNIVIVVAVFLLILYWLHTFIILYHLIRFGVGTKPKQAAFIYFIGSSCLFIFLVLSLLLIIFTPY